MSLVMVVEDEAMLRASMVRSLKRLPGVEVVAASSYAEAREKMLDEWPALLVSDISLPDGSAVGLLAETEAAGLQIPVIFITAYLGRFRDQIPQRDDVEVHEKPVRMRALREWVLQRLNATLDHRRPPFSVTEYLQLASLGNHSAVVRVARDGAQLGWVRLVKGAPWSARAGTLRGLPALQALAFAPEVRVEVDALLGPPGERELRGSLDAILLDAFRIRDDAVRDGKPDPFDTFQPRPLPEPQPRNSEPIPPPRLSGPIPPLRNSAPIPPPRVSGPVPPPRVSEPIPPLRSKPLPPLRSKPLPPPRISGPIPPLPGRDGASRSSGLDEIRFERAMELGLDALLSRDYSAAWLQFTRAEAARPGHPVVRANLARIRQLGKAPDDG